MKNFFSSKLNLILTILLVISIVLVSILIIDVNKKDIVAIDFSDSTIDEVKTWAKDNDIEDKIVITYEFDDSVPENGIIYQSIKEGDAISETIEIVVSRGKDPNTSVPLPEISESLTKAYLDKWFEENGFTNIKYQYVLSDLDLDNVVSINKTNATRNEEVIVTLSCKEDDSLVSIIVPDFSTLSKEDISLWASGYQIKINYSYQNSDTLENDTFVSQNPKAGESVKKNDSVDIVLTKNDGKSSNNDSITVPDTYLWYKEADFIKAIEGLGLKAVKGSSTHSNKSHNTGEVYSYQSSSDGYTFKKGDSVTYYLVDNGENSDSITVPDTLLGKNETDFIKAIEDLGLKVSKQSKTYKSFKYSTNTIYAYDSSSDGITFKKGDSVKYWLVDNGDQSGDTVTVPDTLLGKSEADFIKAIEDLGLKTSKQSTTYKSKKYQTGTIYAYDSSSDGITFKKGDSVKYWLVNNGDSETKSETINVPDSYLGMNESEFIKTIEGLGLKVSKQSKAYKSGKYKTGTIYAYDSTSDGISFKSGDTVKYWLVNNGDESNSSSTTTDTINVPDSYLYLSESEFIKKIEGLGLVASKAGSKKSTNYKNGTVYSYQSTSDGITFKKGDSVKYYVVDNGSAEITPTTTETSFKLDNLIGKTKSEVENYCSTKGISVSFAESYSSSVASGKVISTSPSSGTSLKKGDSISVTISKGTEIKKASILSANMLIANYSKDSYANSEKAIKDYFSSQGFTNVTVNGVSSTKAVGQVISISVNGTKSYSTSDQFELTTPIVIEIVNNQYN